VIAWALFFPTFSMIQVGAEVENSIPSLNRLVLESIATMPQQGGYSTLGGANQQLQRAVITSDGALRVEASRAIPSYCSEATYLVFLKTLARLQKQGLALAPETLKALRPAGQADGSGIWGRWNANGPGTARLFHELGLGPNFTDLNKARPGDFMKVFWTDQIGATEHGHSVVFLGTESRNGISLLRFWSSNLHEGYGEKTVPQSRIRRMLFSRLENPENINRPLIDRDIYLSRLERITSTPEEMQIQCGLTR
jgi:hypothetical protein